MCMFGSDFSCRVPCKQSLKYCCFLCFSRADIAVIGLAVMGQNLILNMADHGYEVYLFKKY